MCEASFPVHIWLAPGPLFPSLRQVCGAQDESSTFLLCPGICDVSIDVRWIKPKGRGRCNEQGSDVRCQRLCTAWTVPRAALTSGQLRTVPYTRDTTRSMFRHTGNSAAPELIPAQT